MKLYQLVNAQEWLRKVSRLEMDIRKAYNLKKFLIQVDEKLKAFHSIREDMIKKYWEDSWWTISVKEENLDIFQFELSKLLEEEIEIDNIPTLLIEDLNWNIDTETLMMLDFLIKDEEELQGSINI